MKRISIFAISVALFSALVGARPLLAAPASSPTPTPEAPTAPARANSSAAPNAAPGAAVKSPLGNESRSAPSPSNAAQANTAQANTAQTNAPSTNLNANAPAKSLTKVPYIVGAAKYAAELRRASSTLNTWKSGGAPTLPQVRNALPTREERIVRRADGSTQSTSGEQWHRFLDDILDARNAKSRVRRGEIRALQSMIALRLQSLEKWTKNDSYQAADAQKIVATLANDGDIRTGPTALQTWWQNFKDSISNFFDNLFKRTTKAATPKVKPPNLNTRWVEFFFVSCVICLLGAIAWYVWRTFGGRWVRRAAREVRFSGEDAELLQLPPEELLSRAAQLARKGDFAGALRHRYIGVLVTLDERGVWRYDTRRTNWEHIAALRKKSRWQNLAMPLGELTRRFDRVRYGNIPCAQTDWARFDADSAQLETQVAQGENKGNTHNNAVSSTRTNAAASANNADIDNAKADNAGGGA